MKKCVLFILITVFLIFSTAHAAIVHSTYSIGDTNIPTGSDMAGRFEVEAAGPNYYLDSIKMYIKDAEDVTADFLTLAITGHDSSNNIPDISNYILSPVNFTDNIPNTYNLIEFNPVEHPILYAGNTYWLVASVESETSVDLLYTWTCNLTEGVGSELAGRNYGEDWDDQTYYPLAYQIHGTAVPIPGAVWLFGSGLLGLVGLKRKLKK